MHIRCPHCNNPVDVVDDNPELMLTCRSCGSSFSLLGSDEHLPPTRLTRQTLGRFELLDQVGVGQFGMVWKARDTELDRIVAIKVPRRGQLTDGDAEQFLREARAAAQLKHPNIVSTHEVGREEETIYIVSDFVLGANLSEWLSGQRLTVREAVQLCVTTARALHHAHESGVVHRDLKPSNIMMDLEGKPHVMDFGLAKREAGEITMTRDGHVLGTPAYMSPEQAGGKSHSADRRTDIYSLGVILYELLTGERPFRGDERMLIVQILTTEASSPRKLNSRIPKDLDTICLKCLEKEPYKRYATAQTLAEELERWLKGEPIVARPISRVARGWRWCKRNRSLASLTAAAALLLITVASVMTAGYFREARLRGETEGALMRESAALGVAQTEKQRAEQAKTDAERSASIARFEGLRADHQAALTRSRRNDLDAVEYAKSLAQADLQAELGNTVRLIEFLDACPPSLRGWEWYHLKKRSQAYDLDLKGHQAAVMQARWHPTGNLIATASLDGTAKVWNASTGEVLKTYQFDTKQVFGIDWSADGKMLAVTGGTLVDGGAGFTMHDGSLTLVDYGSDEKRHLLGPDKTSFCVRFSPNGERLAATVNDGTVKVFDIQSHELLSTCHVDTPNAIDVSWSSDGSKLAVVGYDSAATHPSPDGVSIFEAVSGQPISLLRVPHRGRIYCAGWSHDGARIAVASEDGSLRIYDSASRSELLSIEHPDGLFQIAWSYDDKHLYSGCWDSSVRQWDSTTGALLRSFPGHRNALLAISTSRDGSRLLTSSAILNRWSNPELKVWNLQATSTSNVLTDFDGPSVESIEWSPDGKMIAVGHRDEIRILHSATNQIIDTLRGTSNYFRFANMLAVFTWSPDGSKLAYRRDDQTVNVWDKISRETRLLFADTGIVFHVRWCPDGKRLATAGGDTIRLWDVGTGQLLSTLKATASVSDLQWSPSGGSLVAACRSRGMIYLWNGDFTVPPRTFHVHDATVADVVWSHDGRRIATASDDGTVRIWNVENESLLLEVPFPVRADRYEHACLSWESRHNRLAVGVGPRIHLFNSNDGQLLYEWVGHNDRIFNLKWSPDGRMLATASDKAILWKTLYPDGFIETETVETASLAATTVERLVDRLIVIEEVVEALEKEQLEPSVREAAVKLATDYRYNPRQRREFQMSIRALSDQVSTSAASDGSQAGERWQTYALRGRYYLALQDFQSASADFSKAFELGSTDRWGFAHRATAYRNLKQFERAVQDYREALSLGLDSEKLRLNLADCYRGMKQWDNAVQQYDVVVSKFHDSEAARLGRASATVNNQLILLRDLESNERLKSDMQKVLELHAISDEIQQQAAEHEAGETATEEELASWHRLAFFQLQGADYEGYQKTCRYVLNRYPEMSNAWDASRVVLVCSLGTVDREIRREAIQLAEKRHLEKATWFSSHASALAFYRADEYELALARLQQAQANHATEHSPNKAISWDPSAFLLPQGGHPEDWLLMALVSYRLGKYDLARRWLEKSSQWMEYSQWAEQQGTVDWSGRWRYQYEWELLFDEAKSLIPPASNQQLVRGDLAPALPFEMSVHSASLAIEEFRGKVILLSFFGMYCPPCIASIPKLQQLHEKHSHDGLQIIGVTRFYGFDWDSASNMAVGGEEISQATEKAAISKFAAHNGMAYPIGIVSDREAYDAFGVRGIPHFVVIDPQGKIQFVGTGSGALAELEAIVQESLGNSDSSAPTGTAPTP